MKKIFLPLVLALFSHHLFAQEPSAIDVDSAKNLRESLDLTTEEGVESFLFFNVATAFVDSVEKTQHFSPAQRTALVRAWAPYIHANFSPANAAPLLRIALGVENPYGNYCTDTREIHLATLETYGQYHDVANGVAWFLVSSSEDPADHQKAIELLRGRSDLTFESYHTLGFANHLLGNYDEALQAYFEAAQRLQQTIKVDPEGDPLAPFKRITLLYHIGNTLITLNKKRDAYLAWSTAIVALRNIAKEHNVDVNTLAIGIDIDYTRFSKQIRALRLVLKKEEALQANEAPSYD